MNLSVNGLLPGDEWDVTPHIVFSATSDSFTAADDHRRNITVFLISVPHGPSAHCWLKALRPHSHRNHQILRSCFVLQPSLFSGIEPCEVW